MIILCEKRWIDTCNHPPNSYMGSFHCCGEDYDLYVFDSGSTQSACLRYGDNPGEYMSSFDMVQFITLAVSAPEYHDALELLLTKGRIRFDCSVRVVDQL